MRAVVFEEFRGPLNVIDVEMPRCHPESAVIRVEACGICRSDWHGWMGHDSDVRVPHVPGHELAGVVEEVGTNVSRWNTGQRVTVPFCCGCGTCVQCVTGNSHICDNYSQPGFTHWGAFAQFVEIRHADVNLVSLPDSIDSVTAASLGCRFATSYRAVVTQGEVSAEDIVAVHGCGGVGLSAVMIAASLRARVIAVDVSEAQLAKAAECGAHIVVNALDCEDLPLTVRELSHGGASVSIDALGSKETCYNSVSCLRKQGRHVQIGLTLGDDANPRVPMSAVIANELSIVGSHGMPAVDYPGMLQSIESGQLDPAKLVGERLNLEEACDRLTTMNDFNNVGATVIDRF